MGSREPIIDIFSIPFRCVKKIQLFANTWNNVIICILRKKDKNLAKYNNKQKEGRIHQKEARPPNALCGLRPCYLRLVAANLTALPIANAVFGIAYQACHLVALPIIGWRCIYPSTMVAVFKNCGTILSSFGAYSVHKMFLFFAALAAHILTIVSSNTGEFF